MGTFDQKPQNEKLRIQKLESLEILDTPQSEEFDKYIRLASFISGCPIALISIVDQERQWFKAKCGLDVDETARNISFCTHVVHQGKKLIVSDTKEHDFFKDNPLVKDGVVGFYAGFPIRTREGFIIGTLCIIDSKPKKLSEETLSRISDLAAMVSDAIAVIEINKVLESELSYLSSKLSSISMVNKDNDDLVDNIGSILNSFKRLRYPFHSQVLKELSMEELTTQLNTIYKPIFFLNKSHIKISTQKKPISANWDKVIFTVSNAIDKVSELRDHIEFNLEPMDDGLILSFDKALQKEEVEKLQEELENSKVSKDSIVLRIEEWDAK